MAKVKVHVFLKPGVLDALSRPMAELYFWMKSEICPQNFRQGCCVF